jgi:hypothetical protein
VLNHVVETSRLARSSPPRSGRRPDRQDGRPAARHRQGGRPRGRGPHAAIGAQIAQRTTCRQGRERIAAHHQEVEYACLEAPIVQIADAISASRPGARGETMETYVKRLEDLQAIAESFTGVERSFAVQAGARCGSSSGPRRSTT